MMQLLQMLLWMTNRKSGTLELAPVMLEFSSIAVNDNKICSLTEKGNIIMKASKVMLLAVCGIFLLVQRGQNNEEWAKEEFPNPTINLEACGRRGKVSWICDPESILSYETANNIEELLYSVRKNTNSGCSEGENPGFQIGVAVLNRMRSHSDESVAETAEKFAKHLHDSWGVGNAGCDDGAVLLLSTDDRQVYMSTGRGATKVLTDNQIDLIIEEMKPHLKDKNYDKSVEVAVTKMGEVFSGKVLESSLDYGLILFILFIVATVCLAIYCAHRQDQDLERCTLKLERIRDERDRAKHSQKSYESKSCPICLEEFRPETPTKLLACGHKYCEPCLTKWLQDHSTCPICRRSSDRHSDDGTSCQHPTTYDFIPELQFRLLMLRLQHPSLITSTMVDRWSSGRYTGDFVSDPTFVRLSMPGGGRLGSGTGFGGGGSIGGGGRGGSW